MTFIITVLLLMTVLSFCPQPQHRKGDRCGGRRSWENVSDQQVRRGQEYSEL